MDDSVWEEDQWGVDEEARGKSVGLFAFSRLGFKIETFLELIEREDILCGWYRYMLPIIVERMES